jgi:hypothetical protein
VARWWRDGVVAAAVSLALGCVGCGVLSTEKDQQRASELAEKLFPGKLEVISARPQAVFSPYTGVWRLLPGRVDRFKGYTLFCDQPDERKRCLGRHAVAVTTDLEGNLIGEPTVIRDVRIGNGSLQLPPM